MLVLAVSGSGCAAVVATAGVASSVTAASVKAAGQVTVATVKTSGKVVSSAVTSSGDVTALTMESAAALARAGMVVVVDGRTGAISELPWREGLRLYTLASSDPVGRAADIAAIFRGGRRVELDLKRVRKGRDDLKLAAGDVIEFRNKMRR